MRSGGCVQCGKFRQVWARLARKTRSDPDQFIRPETYGVWLTRPFALRRRNDEINNGISGVVDDTASLFGHLEDRPCDQNF
jgi:hypothetical protein